jgi:hypothetical protein
MALLASGASWSYLIALNSEEGTLAIRREPSESNRGRAYLDLPRLAGSAPVPGLNMLSTCASFKRSAISCVVWPNAEDNDIPTSPSHIAHMGIEAPGMSEPVVLTMSLLLVALFMGFLASSISGRGHDEPWRRRPSKSRQGCRNHDAFLAVSQNSHWSIYEISC